MGNNSMSLPVHFYFDFISPYSYLAWSWVKNEDFILKPVPVTLAQVIHSYETKGPAEIAPKRDYLWKHCLRSAKRRGIPFVMPAKLPFNSSYALRLAIASGNDSEIIDLIFRLAWAEGKDIGDPDVLLQYPELKTLDEVASGKEMRRALKANVAQAIENKVFGTPTFIVNDELFWGDDCKNDLLDFISGNDPLEREQFNYFLDRFGRE